MTDVRLISQLQWMILLIIYTQDIDFPNQQARPPQLISISNAVILVLSEEREREWRHLNFIFHQLSESSVEDSQSR